MERNGALAFAGFMVLFAGLVVFGAFSIRVSPFDPVGARIFPLGVAIFLLLLCMAHFAVELGKRRRPAPAEPGLHKAAAPRVAAVFVIMAVATLLVQVKLIGLLAATAGCVVLSGVALAPVSGIKEVLREALLSALVAGLLVLGAYLLFVRTFGIRL